MKEKNMGTSLDTVQLLWAYFTHTENNKQVHQQ